ncbi:MAG: hypothetical protein QOC66_3550 [Pseudonocardiales bacterium]|jgi:hypothetical protein|nr:hypothetical protein [Pseudonocardiales bacterium]
MFISGRFAAGVPTSGHEAQGVAQRYRRGDRHWKRAPHHVDTLVSYTGDGVGE